MKAVFIRYYLDLVFSLACFSADAACQEMPCARYGRYPCLFRRSAVNWGIIGLADCISSCDLFCFSHMWYINQRNSFTADLLESDCQMQRK